jgi:hypothetical protein
MSGHNDDGIIHSGFKASLCTFEYSNQNKDKKINIRMKYDGKMIYGVETPVCLRAPFGLSHYTKDGADSWSVPVSSETKENATVAKEFFDELNQLQQKFIEFVLANAAVFFPGKKIQNKAVVEALFRPFVKQRDDGSDMLSMKVSDMSERDLAQLKKTLQERISEDNEDEDERTAILEVLKEKGVYNEETSEVEFPAEHVIPNVMFFRPDGSEILIFSYDDLAEAFPEKKPTYGRFIFSIRPWLVAGQVGLKAGCFMMEVEEPSKGRPRHNVFSKRESTEEESNGGGAIDSDQE